MLTLMYITNDVSVAEIAQKYGVERIWVDLETLGKEERQKNMNTVKSKHSISDIKKILPILTSSKILVRINPINTQSNIEIESVIEAGAQIIMLPMWKTLVEVKKFLEIIDKRVKTILLLETKEAVECLDEVLTMEGIDEIHIGLNDLSLSYGLTFMFEPLSNGLIEKICNKITKYGIPYGFGGIAKIGEGKLKAEKIIMEHYRLGSSRVILSRHFCNTNEIKDIVEIENIFKKNIKLLRDYEKLLEGKNEKDFLKNKIELENDINTIIK